MECQLQLANGDALAVKGFALLVHNTNTGVCTLMNIDPEKAFVDGVET
jgi:hypothetical protein